MVLDVVHQWHALAEEPGGGAADGGAGVPGLHAAHAGALRGAPDRHLHLPSLLWSGWVVLPSCSRRGQRFVKCERQVRAAAADEWRAMQEPTRTSLEPLCNHPEPMRTSLEPLCNHPEPPGISPEPLWFFLEKLDKLMKLSYLRTKWWVISFPRDWLTRFKSLMGCKWPSDRSLPIPVFYHLSPIIHPSIHLFGGFLHRPPEQQEATAARGKPQETWSTSRLSGALLVLVTKLLLDRCRCK